MSARFPTTPRQRLDEREQLAQTHGGYVDWNGDIGVVRVPAVTRALRQYAPVSTAPVRRSRPRLTIGMAFSVGYGMGERMRADRRPAARRLLAKIAQMDTGTRHSFARLRAYRCYDIEADVDASIRLFEKGLEAGLVSA